MIERICPACQHGNPLDDRFCGTCGAALERQLPMRRPESRLAVAGRNLPVTWQQLGKTVALSAAALAAEVGLAWLRRRIEVGPASVGSDITPAAARARPAMPETTALARVGGQIVTIVSQRVVEVWDGGEKTRQVVERTFWRRTEE
jgi:hypothetical protein